MVNDRDDLTAYEELRIGFTAAVSHELRTPLARLLSLIESMSLPGADVGALGAFVELGDDLAQQRRRLRRAERDDLPPGLELAEEEHVVDQLVHQLDLRPHLLESRRRVAAGQARTLDQREQARERRP